MQVIRTAIGDFRVNTGNLAFGFQPILAAKFLLGKTALILRKFSRVLCGMAGIAGLETVGCDEQILDAHINANLLIGNGQQRGFKLTQARHEVSACEVFGYGNSGGVRRKLLTPLDSQRLVTLRQLQFPITETESTVSELCRLTVMFGFECGVFRPTFKEVFERSLLVTQALLQRDTGNIIQESKLWKLLDGCESGISASVANFLLRLVVRICAVTQDAVVNVAHTPERLSQQLFLLLVRVETEFVGAFSFHASHYIIYPVNAQQLIVRQMEDAG